MNKFVKKIFSRKFENILFSVGVVCVLVFPLTKINHATKSVSENRNLAVLNNMTSKKCSHGNILKWTKSFESWLNDRFRGREKIINAYKKWDYTFIGKVENSRALMGENGWLFYIDKKDGNSLANYQNKTRFTDRELEKIKNNIVRQKKLLAAHGIDYYVVIAPDKNRIYGEYYPSYIHKVAEKGRAELLVEYLENDGVDVIYPRLELLNRKKDGVVYFPWDTHWNNYGAFVGYSVLMDRIMQRHSEFGKMEKTDFIVEKVRSTGGDIFNMLNMNKSDMKEYDCGYLNMKPLKPYNYKTTHINEHRLFYTINEKAINDSEVYMLRDSFTSAMQPYISETFKRVEYHWTHDFNGKYLDMVSKHPTIVIHELVERYTPTLLQDASVLKE